MTPETETYEITQLTIDSSYPNMPWEANPVSIAMLEQWGGFHMVHEDMVHITNTEIGRTYKMDEEAQSVVRRFSEGKRIEPCKFTVTVVDQNFYKFIQGGDMTKPAEPVNVVAQPCTPVAVPPDAP